MKNKALTADAKCVVQGAPRRRGQFEDIMRRFIRNKLAIVGLLILLLLVFTAVFADVIADYDATAIAQDTDNRLLEPSAEHIFGTDQYGRDVFARIIHGARSSLLIGFVCATAAMLVGGLIGALAGFYGKLVDSVLMRMMDILLAIPAILLAIAIISALGPGIANLILAMTIANIPGSARLVRVSVLSIRSQEYVEAARSIGCSDAVIILRHIIPNVVGPLIVQLTLQIAMAILFASGLSFIGLGVQPPAPEWGAMLSEGAQVIRYAPHLVYFPGLAIFITVLSINFLGDGLRDSLDPRLKR